MKIRPYAPPLRYAVSAPILVIVAFTALVVWFVSFQSGRSAVNDVAGQLRGELLMRITEQLSNRLEAPHKVNSMNATAIESGLVQKESVKTIDAHFAAAIKTFPAVVNGYFGAATGDEFGARRQDNGDIWVFELNARQDGRIHYFSIDEQGDRIKEEKVSKPYDPRTRPWYKAAVSAKKPVWSKSFYSFTGRGLVLSGVRPIYHADGDLQGVVSSSVLLPFLGDFLKSLRIGENGQAMVMDPEGNLVATSTDEPLVKIQGKKATRIKARDSENRLTAAMAMALEKQFGAFSTLEEQSQFEFHVNDELQFGQVVRYRDDYGLDWLIVVVAPESDFMRRIHQNTQWSAGLSLAALCVSILTGLALARWISHPVEKLNSAVEGLAGNDFSQLRELAPIAEREDEVGALACAFQTMGLSLKEAIETLEQRVVERTEELEEVNKSLKDAQHLARMGNFSREFESGRAYWSESMYQMFGFAPSPKRPPGMDEAIDLFHRDDRPALKEILTEGLATGQPQELELRATGADGAERVFFFRFVGRFDEEGRLTGYHGVTHDITERKALERLREEVQVILRHDLKSPLQGVISMPLLMMEDENLTQKQVEDLQLIHTAAMRMLDQINSSLELFRIETGTYDFTPKPLAPEAVLKSVIDIFKDKANVMQVSVSFEQDESVPEQCNAMAEESLLFAVCANLLTNAMEASPLGAAVSVVQRCDAQYVHFDFRNQGEISEEIKDRFFEKYATFGKKHGTGLGAYTAKLFMEAMNGAIALRTAQSPPEVIVTISLQRA